MGGTISTIIFLVGAVILLSLSGGFATNAAVRITKIKNYKKNIKLKRAHDLLSWASVATWVGVAIIITLIVLYLIFGLETAEYTSGFVFKGLVFISIGLVLLVGILSAIAANDIRTSGEKDNDGSFKHAVIAASLSIGTIGLFLIIFMINAFAKNKNK